MTLINSCRSALILERIAIAFTGKWPDLRYGTGSVSDLSIEQKAF